MNNENKKVKYIFFKNISSIDRFNFYEYLSVMLNAGVGMGKSLESAMEKIDNVYFNTRINKLLIFIMSGDSLSKAMKKDPLIFSDYEISVIESGETTGTLDKSLIDLALKIKKSYDLKKKVKSAFTYPSIIFLFLISAVIIVLKYVIPALMPLFETTSEMQTTENGEKILDLPFATMALINTSNFVSNNFIYIIPFIATLVVLFIGYKNTANGERKIENLILSIPLVGIVYKNYILANIASSMGNLIGAGVPTLKVLKLVGQSSGSIIYEDIFKILIKNVEKGERIVESMRAIDVDKFYFPSAFIQMLSVGEKTANIQEICKKIHIQYTREVNYSLVNLIKWLEPIAILIAALFVVWFAFAIFGAIMKVTTSIG